MQFDSLQALIEMGGHGPYVWSVYTIVFFIVLYNFLWPLRLNARKLEERRRLLEREQRQQAGYATSAPLNRETDN